jgi:hypothetical protein
MQINNIKHFSAVKRFPLLFKQIQGKTHLEIFVLWLNLLYNLLQQIVNTINPSVIILPAKY